MEVRVAFLPARIEGLGASNSCRISPMTQAEGGRDRGRERFRWPECTPGRPLTHSLTLVANKASASVENKDAKPLNNAHSDTLNRRQYHKGTLLFIAACGMFCFPSTNARLLKQQFRSQAAIVLGSTGQYHPKRWEIAQLPQHFWLGIEALKGYI